MTDASPGSWFLRPAKPSDAAAISEVYAVAAVQAWGGFLGADRVRAATHAQHHPADLVAVDDEGVFAFVAWDAATGEVLRLYTHPRGAGRGAGRALLDRAVEELRAAGRTQAWLNTEERNEGARRFYERNGWHVDGDPRVREWHGTQLREPRHVKDL